MFQSLTLVSSYYYLVINFNIKYHSDIMVEFECISYILTLSSNNLSMTPTSTVKKKKMSLKRGHNLMLKGKEKKEN